MTSPDPHIGDPVLERAEAIGCLSWIVALIVVMFAVGLWLGSLR